MRTIALASLASLLLISGLGLAAQINKPADRSSKDHPPMMEDTMKDSKDGSRMGGMMRMMKMMDQCAAMMESTHDSKAKES
jgi:hypothetical protein